MPRLTDKAWSPYLAGALIGLLQIPAFLFLGTALGASSSFVTAGASLAEFLDPGIRGIRYAAAHLDGAKNWWQVALVIGVAIGAFASSRLSGAVRRGVAPVWQRATGLGRGGRFAMAFAAGFLMLLGARIADGCTSGHGLSGMAQLSLGSFAAVAAMFAGGILTATLLFRPVR
ncbi:YeeE/YedE thiosulfate transporter family protein [Neoroseomonas oryzicola]|uniref:YeeE/YedE family protein n=1 Tax=Neoroseomonas oryzicola TaxID=535904 RepID=A0A9X9WGC6_9PROT|nr:YeeE/YedE thiosulfate transporter family protein [Neoroseomonas oryzicola]MBR0659386.1 YeeE/YedE family protein [Neoroseomonas oryzicola]NKE16287.1 YeeE/YedE family protein [Neoroseomonas oryzicola]